MERKTRVERVSPRVPEQDLFTHEPSDHSPNKGNHRAQRHGGVKLCQSRESRERTPTTGTAKCPVDRGWCLGLSTTPRGQGD